jgi:hypothetical protein
VNIYLLLSINPALNTRTHPLVLTPFPLAHLQPQKVNPEVVTALTELETQHRHLTGAALEELLGET